MATLGPFGRGEWNMRQLFLRLSAPQLRESGRNPDNSSRHSDVRANVARSHLQRLYEFPS